MPRMMPPLLRGSCYQKWQKRITNRCGMWALQALVAHIATDTLEQARVRLGLPKG